MHRKKTSIMLEMVILQIIRRELILLHDYNNLKCEKSRDGSIFKNIKKFPSLVTSLSTFFHNYSTLERYNDNGKLFACTNYSDSIIDYSVLNRKMHLDSGRMHSKINNKSNQIFISINVHCGLELFVFPLKSIKLVVEVFNPFLNFN